MIEFACDAIWSWTSVYWNFFSYCHFIDCFGFVFVSLFSSLLLLFSPLVVWWVSLVLYWSWFFLFLCVSIVEFYFEVILKFCIGVCIYMRLFEVIGLLIASVSPVSCLCTLLMFLILVAYLCMDDFLSVVYIYMPLLVSLVICGIFVSSCGLFFSVERSSFSICCKAILVLLNSLSFCLSVKLWFLLQIWMGALLDKVILKSVRQGDTNIKCYHLHWESKKRTQRTLQNRYWLTDFEKRVFFQMRKFGGWGNVLRVWNVKAIKFGCDDHCTTINVIE